MLFSHIGNDYAGPIKIKASSGRGRISVKGYIAVFVCFVTKAVHLEAVSSYDTAHFMNAFRRFIARRGLCSKIYSDCGNNFVGADSALKAFFKQGSDNVSKIVTQVSDKGIKWHFNPPVALHYKGL